MLLTRGKKRNGADTAHAGPLFPAPIHYNLEDLDAVLERRLKFVSEAWGYASAYDTAITIAGYGAFFALWAGVADDVTSAARATTATLMGISLLLYIGWTITMMMARHLHDREFIASITKAQTAADAIAEWDRVETRKRDNLIRIQHRFWMPVFGGAVGTALAGTLTLVYNCLAIATGLPQLTGTL